MAQQAAELQISHLLAVIIAQACKVFMAMLETHALALALAPACHLQGNLAPVKATMSYMHPMRLSAWMCMY